jgi:hypothetical protein
MFWDSSGNTTQFVDTLKLEVSDPYLIEITKNNIKKNSCPDSFEHRFNINENL